MATNVYYSVCPFGTGNLLTGGSPTIVVDGSGNATLTLGGATQVDNIGLGVAVVYNSITSYISEITSATAFKLVNAVGAAASSQTSTAVTSINHEYASLSAFEAGYTDANHINNSSLVSADVLAHACCYYDHDDSTLDTSAVTFAGVTMDSTRRVVVLSPVAGTESVNAQYPTDGVWSSSKYALSVAGTAITAQDIGLRLRNMQIECTTANDRCLIFDTAVAYVADIDESILTANSQNFAYIVFSSAGSGTINFTNCTIYDCNKGGIRSGSNTVNVVNCTIYNCATGLYQTGGTMTATNTAVFANGSNDYRGTITATYCASDDSKAGTGNFQITQSGSDYAALVTDALNGDFSLTDNSSELYNAGTNTGAPDDDIIGTSRPQATTTDIGAFELIVGGGEAEDVAGNLPAMSGAVTKKVAYHRSMEGVL